MSRINMRNVERGQCSLLRLIAQSITKIILAENYMSLLRNGDDDPVDVGESIDMRLPDFHNAERIKR